VIERISSIQYQYEVFGLRNKVSYKLSSSAATKMLFKRGLKEDGEWSVTFSKHAEIPARTRSQTGNKFNPARIEWVEALPLDVVPITPDRALRAKGWRERTGAAPAPMASDWEEWILNNWVEPSEATLGRIRELVEKRRTGSLYSWEVNVER
jgi:hypothetical protein